MLFIVPIMPSSSASSGCNTTSLKCPGRHGVPQCNPPATPNVGCGHNSQPVRPGSGCAVWGGHARQDSTPCTAPKRPAGQAAHSQADAVRLCITRPAGQVQASQRVRPPAPANLPRGQRSHVTFARLALYMPAAHAVQRHCCPGSDCRYKPGLEPRRARYLPAGQSAHAQQVGLC